MDENLLFHSLSLCKVCTKESKLLSMQFKRVHNMINCGFNLKKWGIRDSKGWQVCNENIRDTIVFF